MAWGILDDPHIESPPGTANITESTGAGSHVDSSHLKKSGDIILQPQPSDSPNDPLNWSPLWKNSIMLILSLSSAVTGSLVSMLTPGLTVLASQYHVSLDTVSSNMIGLLSFWTGLMTFITASGATVWGKRPFFVISMVVLLATCIWGFAATTFASLSAMRIIQGLASAPVETLVTATVSDLFFVHQRGSRLAIWNVMLGAGFLLGQAISGVIIEAFSPQATFGVCALWFGVLLPLMFFFVLETAYDGPRPTIQAVTEDVPTEKIVKNEDEKIAEKKDSTESMARVQTLKIQDLGADDVKEPYTRKLRLWRGRVSKESFWKGVIKPVPLICYPAVLFSTIVQGLSMTCLTVLALLSVSIGTGPDYRLTPVQLGLTNIPILFVILIFSPLAGWLVDKVATFMARRNNGIFEPEYRLTLMAIAVPLSTLSFLLFGMAAQRKAPISVLVVFGCMQAASVPFAAQAALTYVIDCHPNDANQAFVTINFIKAVFTFVATTYVNTWYEQLGAQGIGNVLAGINLSVSLLTIPSYIYGKRFRSMIARSKIAKKISS